MSLSKILRDHLSCVWQLHTQKRVSCKEKGEIEHEIV